jgi:periplasmic protein CpxP/Spy
VLYETQDTCLHDLWLKANATFSTQLSPTQRNFCLHPVFVWVQVMENLDLYFRSHKMRIYLSSIALGAALILGLSGSSLRAQDQPAAGAPPPAASSAPSSNPQQDSAPDSAPDSASNPASNSAPSAAPNPERQANMLAKKLGLTPDQQSKIETILANRQQQIQTIRADNTLAPRDRRAKVQQISRESDSDINAVLTGAQQKQYQQLKEERREKRQERQQQQQGQQQDQQQQAPPAADSNT